jgi:hypothetical protein
MNELKKGQKVFWRDPEDETSGVYEVCEKTDNFACLIGNGVCEVEADVSDIYELSQKVIFRKWCISGTVIALFPEQELDDRPRMVASYDSGSMERDADCDFVMEATIAANKEEYKNLLEELKREGYDAPEIVHEQMSVCKLVGMMDFIARKLIASVYITDFTVHDRKSILESNAGRAFIWQVRKSGTWLYFLDEADWKKRLSDRMEVYKSSSNENLYYLFDGQEFYPVFEQKVLEMLNE